MFTYKSEVLKIANKWWGGGDVEKDVSNLDALINRRTAEGWEFVTYSCMADCRASRDAILVTFRKEK